MADYFFLPNLRNIHGVLNAFSGKSFGNMSYVWGGRDVVSDNRKVFIKELGIPDCSFLTIGLTHGTGIRVAKGSDFVQVDPETPVFNDADAVIISEPNKYLFFCSADCLPVIIYDNRQKIIAGVHLGWKGIVGKLHILTLLKMVSEFGSSIKDVIVGIGPGICFKCNWQQGRVLQCDLPEWKDYIARDDSDKYFVDLRRFVLDGFSGFGVEPNQIEASSVCTVENNNRIFSSEGIIRAGDTENQGRFAVVLGMSK